MTDFEALLACYRSGQISERQWQEHLKDREFREWVENQNPINCPSACSGRDNPARRAKVRRPINKEATMADIAEKLRATTIEMASACSVDMHLWNAHSNAALEAISEIERLRTLNAEMREALCRLANALEVAPGPRGVMDLVPGALEKAHAAIAKAEGRS